MRVLKVISAIIMLSGVVIAVVDMLSAYKVGVDHSELQMIQIYIHGLFIMIAAYITARAIENF